MADPKKILGGLGKVRKALLADEKALPDVHYADPLKPATMRMSEALGNAGAEGKTLNFTEADRSRVFGSNRGGVGFSGLQHYSLPHQQANTVWGFGNETTAKKKVRQNDPEKSIWTTFVGAPTQHKSNTVVLQDAVKEFQDAVKAGKVHPAQIELMNKRIKAATDDKTGARLFDEAYDLTDPAALSAANSFARRSAIGDVLLGEGVKGEMRRKAFKQEHGGQTWHDSGKMESILKRETDPDLVDAGTFDVGNRLFVMDNGVIHRPDLNVAFPYQVTGNDLGMKFQLTPKEAAMRDWMKQYEGRVDKKGNPAPASYMDLARNNPSQFVGEDFLTFLQKEGHKKGGAVDIDAADARLTAAIEKRMAKGGAVDIEAADARLQAAIDARMADGGKVVKGAAKVFKKLFNDDVLPMTERDANLAKFLEPSKIQQRLYHGTTATEGGKGTEAIRRIKPSKEGSLGSGVYLTPRTAHASGYSGIPNDDAIAAMRNSPYSQDMADQFMADRASGTLREGQMGGNMLPVHAQIKNPLIIEGTHGDPAAEALIKLGMDEDSAIRMVERAYEEKGNIGKQIQARAQAAGYDGLAQYRDGELSEVVSYNPNAVKSAIGNQGTYDTSLPDLNKAEGGGAFKKLQFMADGGIPHMADAGRVVKGMGKLGKKLFADPAESSVTSARRGERMADQMGGNTIVKETGGNWLGGETEKQLKRLQMGDTVPKNQMAELQGSIDTAKRVTGRDAGVDRAIRQMENELDTQARNNAMNAWMESNLTNYVKKQMGTADDPVRKLAEQDILHMKPYGTREAGSLVMRKRAGLGYPAQGLGQSETAKFWERLSDQAIDAYPAGSYKHGALDESILTNNPWLQNVPDETMIHSGKGLTRELGFDHITDVLREDLRAGRIRPEQLNKVSMEQAVRRTHEYDQEMARRMAETQIKATEGMPIHKDYADKGYKWIELSPSKELPEGWTSAKTSSGELTYFDPQGVRHTHPDADKVSTALKYEGDTMGHCVGNYCPDVLSGKSRIYSLRDAKGEPHVTIEVNPANVDKGTFPVDTWFKSQPKEMQDAITNAGYTGYNIRHSPQFKEAEKNAPPSIKQIKGKGNAAPKEDYLPFVQDFVKSGQWSDVGDLSNAGLRDVKFMTNPSVYENYLERGLKVPKYATEKELDELHNEYLRLAEPRNYKPPAEGMAEGGGAFKTIQWAKGYDGGGLAVDVSEPSENSRRGPLLTERDWANIKRNAPEVYEWAKQNVKDEASQLKTAGGMKDFALRTGAQYLGGIPDLINLGLMGIDAGLSTPRRPVNLSSEKPWFGSEQYMDAMHKAGMLGENEFPIAETLAGVLMPAGLIKKGIKKMRGPSIKEEPKKRQGGLSAMAR